MTEPLRIYLCLYGKLPLPRGMGFSTYAEFTVASGIYHIPRLQGLGIIFTQPAVHIYLSRPEQLQAVASSRGCGGSAPDCHRRIPRWYPDRIKMLRPLPAGYHRWCSVQYPGSSVPPDNPCGTACLQILPTEDGSGYSRWEKAVHSPAPPHCRSEGASALPLPCRRIR